jgi:hypothetical protein
LAHQEELGLFGFLLALQAGPSMLCGLLVGASSTVSLCFNQI